MSSFLHQGSNGKGETTIVCDEIAVLLADPLVERGCDNVLQPLPKMTISREEILRILTNALPKQVCIDFNFATQESLQTVVCNKKDAKNRIVHLICHGKEGVLNLESNQGGLYVITSQHIKDLYHAQNIHLMMISSCYSKEIGQAFVDAGISHVICCEGKISDFAVTTFAKMFYQKLSNCTIQESFRVAQLAVKHIPSSVAKEEEQFILLPTETHTKDYHQRRVTFRETTNIITQSETLNMDYNSHLLCFPRLSHNFLGRQKEIFLIFRNYHHSVIHLTGQSGIGKSTLATYVAKFGLERRIFDSVAWFSPRLLFTSSQSSGRHEMPSHDKILDSLLQQLSQMICENKRNWDQWILSFIQLWKNKELFLVVDVRHIKNYHETILPDILERLTKENIKIKILIISKDLNIKKPTRCFAMELKPLTFQDMVALFVKCCPQVECFNTSYKHVIASSFQELEEKIFRRDACKNERRVVEAMSKREADLFVLLGNGNPRTIERLANDEDYCRKVMELAKQHDFVPNKKCETRHELERSLDGNNSVLQHEVVLNPCVISEHSGNIDSEKDYLINRMKELRRQEADLVNELNEVENKVVQEERHQHILPIVAATKRSISHHPSRNVTDDDVGAAPPNTHATQDDVKYVIKKGTLVSFASSMFSKVGIVVASNEFCRGCTGVLGDVTKHGGEALKMDVEKLQTLPNTNIRCQPGNAVMVGHDENNYGSLKVPYIIFAVAPKSVCNKDIRNQLLRDAYHNALKIAETNKLDAVAFSLLGGGNRCTEQQKEEVIRIGVDALFSFTHYHNLKEVYHYGYSDKDVRDLIKICKEKL